MRIQLKLFSLYMVLCAFIPHQALAITAQELKPLSENFLKAQLAQQPDATFTLGNIDPRLRLADCSEPLAIALFNPPTPLAGRVTLQINCPAPSPWKIYIPATLHIFKQVLVAKQALARGHSLNAADVEIQKRPIESLRSAYFSQTEEVIGKIIKRPLAAQAVITASQLENAVLVTKNQQVTINSQNSTVQVKANGIALMDGSLGERIRVRNTSSQKVIEATVEAAGIVRVNP